ncbi:hypothetical protein DRO41_05880 [Candidatus Bathyarchaeota archaeon]|nr:MAG: hypothetical protein DRO41_05880 [Candidatus Bathyarchaeota archaeon]
MVYVKNVTRKLENTIFGIIGWGKEMVRCVDCANFNPRNRYCKWYNSFIAEKEIQKNIPCPGFKRARKHHRVPDYKLVRC